MGGRDRTRDEEREMGVVFGIEQGTTGGDRQSWREIRRKDGVERETRDQERQKGG